MTERDKLPQIVLDFIDQAIVLRYAQNPGHAFSAALWIHKERYDTLLNQVEEWYKKTEEQKNS